MFRFTRIRTSKTAKNVENFQSIRTPSLFITFYGFRSQHLKSKSRKRTNLSDLLEVTEDVRESVDGQRTRLVDADEGGAQLGVSSRHLKRDFII
jgi:hypothetical protein